MARHPNNTQNPPLDPVIEAGDWSDGDLDFDGTTALFSVTPAASTYILLSKAFKAKKATVRAGARLRFPSHVLMADELILDSTAILDCDGNQGSGAAAGTVTVPSQLLSNAGDLYGILGAGGVGRATAGVGTAGTAPGGTMMGAGAGRPGAAGVQAAQTNADVYALRLGIRQKAQFRNRRFPATFRLYTSNTLYVVNSGQGGAGGSTDITVGTATSGGGGSAGGVGGIIARKLTMGAGSRISARGGAGGNASAAGGGMAGGGAPGGGGWLWIDVDEFDAHPTAVIDCDSGTPGTGAGGGLNADAAPPGSVVMFIRGKPAPRQRVMWVGDSLVTGVGDAYSVSVGGFRTEAMRGKYSCNLPWLPVGEDEGGTFPNNDMCGGTGLTIEQVAAKMVIQAPQFLAHRDGWPNPIVCIQLGTNNLSGTYNEANAVAAYSGMLDTIYAANPGAIVFISNIIENGTGSYTTNGASFNIALKAMVEARAEYIAGYIKPIIDLRTLYGTHSLLTYWADNSHPNPTGYIYGAINGWKVAFTAAGL